MRPRVQARACHLAVAGLFISAFAILRIPLYTEPGVVLGWNSDASLYGLIARSMLEAHRPFFLFWASDYLGTLTSMWAVIASLAVGEMGPLALRIGVALEIGIGLLLFWDALGRIYGRVASSIALLWLGAGPFFFFKLSYAPVSAEQMFFLGAVVFWYVVQNPCDRLARWLVVGILSGIGWWAHRGTLFVVLPALAVTLLFDPRQRRLRALGLGAVSFVAGFAAGVVPLLVGRTEINQRLYIPVVPPWSIQYVYDQVRTTLSADLWTFLGTEDLGRFAWIAGTLLVALAVRGVLRAWTREHVFAAGVVLCVFGFWFFSAQAYSGAVRYLILALPIVYAWIASGILRIAETPSPWKIAAATAIVLTIGGGLYAARARDAGEVAAGLREQHEHWPGGFDPRPVLARLESERYPVCYADFWLAYKLEWLSTSGVRFIPYRSVNSSQVRSLRLASAEGRKCYVSLDGNVHELNAQEQAAFRADTIALIEGRGHLARN